MKIRRRYDDAQAAPDAHEALVQRVRALEQEVQECRQLNRRLADVVDVVVELLVPAVDRDDTKLADTLRRLRPDA